MKTLIIYPRRFKLFGANPKSSEGIPDQSFRPAASQRRLTSLSMDKMIVHKIVGVKGSQFTISESAIENFAGKLTL